MLNSNIMSFYLANLYKKVKAQVWAVHGGAKSPCLLGPRVPALHSPVSMSPTKEHPHTALYHQLGARALQCEVLVAAMYRKGCMQEVLGGTSRQSHSLG